VPGAPAIVDGPEGGEAFVSQGFCPGEVVPIACNGCQAQERSGDPSVVAELLPARQCVLAVPNCLVVVSLEGREYTRSGERATPCRKGRRAGREGEDTCKV
jgi:hypothetical protein